MRYPQPLPSFLSPSLSFFFPFSFCDNNANLQDLKYLRILFLQKNLNNTDSMFVYHIELLRDKLGNEIYNIYVIVCQINISL